MTVSPTATPAWPVLRNRHRSFKCRDRDLYWDEPLTLEPDVPAMYTECHCHIDDTTVDGIDVKRSTGGVGIRSFWAGRRVATHGIGSSRQSCMKKCKPSCQL